MIQAKIQRKPNAEADFTNWDLDDEIERLRPFINKMLNNALSVVFSTEGADAWLHLRAFDETGVPLDEIQIVCDIDIEELEAFASVTASLNELVTDAALNADEAGKQKIAGRLRDLADAICPRQAIEGSGNNSRNNL